MNHALSEMISLRGELEITFDVGSRVQVCNIMRTSQTSPQKCKKKCII